MIKEITQKVDDDSRTDKAAVLELLRKINNNHKTKGIIKMRNEAVDEIFNRNLVNFTRLKDLNKLIHALVKTMEEKIIQKQRKYEGDSP